jgi:hypothetical protein
MFDTRLSFFDNVANLWKRVGTSSPLPIGLYDGSGNKLNSFSGALNVHDADVHTESVVHYVFQDSGSPYTLSVNAAQLDTSITLTSVVGLSVNDYLHITDTSNNNHEHSAQQITAIVGSVVTLSNPLDHAFLAASTTVQKILRNMNLSGSIGSPQIFKLQPSLSETWHITHISVSITDNSVMDDATFGGISALANGLVVRVVNATTTDYFTLFRWKTNSSFQRDAVSYEYNAKAPSGVYGFTAHIELKNTYGTIARIANTATENIYLDFLIQDNLTALSTLEIKCHGHIETA